jgi:putative effector of murein hydrolase
MALALALACFFLGAWLGTRFKVAVLFPATLAVIVAVWCVSFLGSQPYSLSIVAQLAAVMAIQAGYVASVLIDARFARFRATVAKHARKNLDAINQQ